MASLILFMALFGSYSSQPNHCGWAIIEDALQPLDFCQQERAPDESILSYMLSCSLNNDKIEAKWWRDTNTCAIDVEPYKVTYPITDTTTTFNCNDTTAPCSSSYLTYKTYLTDECISASGHIITDRVQQSDAPPHDSSPFRETTLITNTCYNSTHSPYYSLITCTNDSYSIHSYLDASCHQFASTQVIESAECKEISFCSHPMDIPSTTSSYFTTTSDMKRCNFINNIGYNIPTDQCMTMSSSESQQYECDGKGGIQWSYFGNGKCDGTHLYSMEFPRVGIIEMNCNDDTCSDAQYMELIIYKTEDDCGTDAISETDYESHLYVVNTCMITPDGGGVMYQCINNKDDATHAGYNVTTYHDATCLYANETVAYSEVECVEESQRRQHMVFCNGANNITIPQNESSYRYIIDCNYFINHHQDALGRIGEPLNVCMSMQHGATAMYSKKYQCNATRDGIEEVVYRGEACLDDNIAFTEQRPEFKTFYCESANDCNSIASYETTDEWGETVVLSNYDAVLIGKQYTNETCTRSESVEQFWSDQYIIIDECWPIQSDLYAVIECDSNGFVYHSLYTHEQCTPDSLVSVKHRFASEIDCIYGKLFATMHCPHWTATTTPPPIISTTEYEMNVSRSTVMETTAISATTTVELESTEEDRSTTAAAATEETTEEATASSDIVVPSTTQATDVYSTEEGDAKLGKEEKECVNVFGGRDRGGIDCNTWALIIIVLIALLAVIIGAFVLWCLCSNDTESCRKQLLARRGSKMHIANGNGNDDLQDIAVQQLNKGQHVKPAVLPKVDEVEDDGPSDGLDL